MASGITIKASTAASIPTPSADKITLFSNSADSDIPYYKNDAGTSASLQGAAGPGYDDVQAHGNTGATETFDYATADYHTATLDANCTFTFTGATNGVLAILGLRLTQDGSGSRTVTWPGSVVWAEGGVAPTLQTAAAAVDLLWFETTDGGTTWYGHYGRLPLTTRGDLLVRDATKITRLAIGAANTVLHGSATDPAYSAVVEADITLADNTTNNAATTKHGFLKKLSNSATDYMDGTGNWSVPAGGGGGITLSTSGYTTAGASYDTNRGLFLKKITLASTKVLLSIAVNVKGDGTNVCASIPVVYDDNAGAPRNIISPPWPSITTSPTRVGAMILNTTARWLQLPVGMVLAAGDYWIGVWHTTTDNYIQLAYDASGSDYYIDTSDAQNEPTDQSIQAASTSTNKYSIYGNLLA